MRSITHEEYKNRLAKINPNVTLLGRYTKMNERITVCCNICNHEWTPLASSLSSGHGCPKCKSTAKMTPAKFVQRVSKISPSIEILSNYDGSFSYIDCRCKTCGNRWSTMATVLLHGSGCPECGKPKAKSQQRFIEDVKQRHPNILVQGTYKNAHTRIQCTCQKCGHEWTPFPYNLINGEGCPVCGSRKQHLEQTKTLEYFRQEMKYINPAVTILGPYINAHSYTKAQCNLCGNIWSITPMDLRRGNGCPSCSICGTSYSEQFILIALRKVLGNDKVLSRDTTLIGKELDIAIPEQNLAIEPGSWYWHKDKSENDKEKRILCKKKGFV